MRRGVSFDDDEGIEEDGMTTDTEMPPPSASTSVGSISPPAEPVCLQGLLQCRKSGAFFRWKRRFVHLDLIGGGSITAYRGTTTLPELAQLHRSVSVRGPEVVTDGKPHVDLHIPASWPWVAKDVENDSASFVIEVPTSDHEAEDQLRLEIDEADESISDEDFEEEEEEEEGGSEPAFHPDAPLSPIHEEPLKDMARAKSQGKPFRIYFKCKASCNEKALWLRAFTRLGRLSLDTQRKKNKWSLHLPFTNHRSRIRSLRDAILARDARRLDMDDDSVASIDKVHIVNDVEHQVRGDARTSHSREHRVQPSYAYPHRWMTRQEMRDEMVLPSSHFHDLRVPNCTQKEIGNLRVEVLQCIGLPKLDRVTDTDAAVYLVCGSYAFTTDIISERANPMWLRNSRRACIFPLFHGYARFYAGVFDDDGPRAKDDFAGRVVVDLARLRPGTSYDVTLPLRLSTHVYSRRRRGAIRLRFSLEWNSERDALLSYIPRTLKIPLPQHTRPNTGVTVACADEKAFRNICITVHGAHLPGRFTFQQMRAAIREINFTRKFILTSIRIEFRETRTWVNPGVSAYVFLTWMHSVYKNSFSLVPAYFIFYLLLQLMRTYVKYGIDGPGQRGFIPPSWEEMLAALFTRDSSRRRIEPLELGLRPLPIRRWDSRESLQRSVDTSVSEKFGYNVSTHVPKGKWLFRALGLIPKPSTRKHIKEDDHHLEFPFADGVMYPKFTVKECLMLRKGEQIERISTSDKMKEDNGVYEITDGRHGELKTKIPRFDMHLDELMRKNSSGFNDKDGELTYFAPRRAVYYTGKTAGRKAASTLTFAASEITEFTGLNTVVNPIRDGIGTGLNHVRDGVSSGVDMLSPSHWRATTSEDNPAGRHSRSNSEDLSVGRYGRKRTMRSHDLGFFDGRWLDTHKNHGDMANSETTSLNSFPRHEEDGLATCSIDSTSHHEWENVEQPVQNIDVEGPSTGKKLTEDLDEIKDKMHELTWHLFDDQAYVLDKKKDHVYFGQSNRPEKRRSKDVGRKLDKLLHLGQYSHSNPFVARVGLYVEPIIGSAYSFLCLFRAGFNVVTWRDPMLTFWLSVVLAVLGAVLLIFPWRIFLFLAGGTIVGPQNWAIRILRELGHLPPLKPRKPPSGEETSACDTLEQPVFSNSRPNRNGVVAATEADPSEVHRVVMPYNPLIYQRFYDWPPEPQYAQAKKLVGLSNSKPNRARRGRSSGSLSSESSLPARHRAFSEHSRGAPARSRTFSEHSRGVPARSRTLSEHSRGVRPKIKAV